MERGKRIKQLLLFFVGGIVTSLLIAGLTVGLILIFKPKSSETVLGDISCEFSERNNSQTIKLLRPLWGWRCEEKRCVKFKLTSENNSSAMGLPLCRLNCNVNDDIGTLWPKPSGFVQVSKDVVKIDPTKIVFLSDNFKGDPDYWAMAQTRFRHMQRKKIPFKQSLLSGSVLIIRVIAESNTMTFDYNTHEGYNLTITRNADDIQAVIKSANFYGARHGLETLSQLIVYDNIVNELFVISGGEINDEPRFKHRGISLDTSRNFFPVDAIKRTINGMAMVKLNTFHWHITDSQSFPLLLKSHPELSEWGSYSLDKIYTPSDVLDIVKYAKARGVRVLPEIDIPGHVGEGWYMKNLTSCYSKLPEEPCKGAHPCGQLDPSKDEVYEVLENIYRELNEYFNPDIFHMGGDEVFMECWNASKSLQDWMVQNRGWDLTTDDFMKLWGYFQDNALASLDQALSRPIPVILWSSTLTQEPSLTTYLDKARYIIQVWTQGQSPEIKTLLENGYNLIVTNSDALYLDCGFGSWVRDGNNWCSPYIGWQKVYDNRMETIAGQYVDQVYGAEAALWAEQVDEWSLDARIWPRASALAERLWSNPETAWRDAESRMLVHRSILVEVGGLGAEQLQPEWCLQNEGVCPM